MLQENGVMNEMPYYKLYNGVMIPFMGFGVGTVKPEMSLNKYAILYMKEKVKNVLVPNYKISNRYPVRRDMLKTKKIAGVIDYAVDICGCRLFDTARAYQKSEYYLGNAIKPYVQNDRDDFFIITKVTNQAQATHGVRECYEESLKELQMEYVDLLMLHWPQTDTFVEAWKELENIYFEGKCKAIGVCNCNIKHLEMLMKNCDVIPMVNEIECHPLLQQNDVIEFCSKNNIQVIAHTPTGRMDKRIIDGLKDIAEMHNVSVADIIMCWHYKRGIIPIPNSINTRHLKDNFSAISKTNLTDDEMESVKKLNCDVRIWPDPDNCDFSVL
ncbi:aldo/keto reductase family protein [Butyrivibrio sp. MB2005]|uniref:aldo/keto reductase family protein n=1 Tax=Butyrivibrio sp. MB2005 TaxID=1280678 RepID=UPI000686F961|nr:aldo/keto reductase [Butyrivibrio sp. MB2005]